jgi:DNA helicase-2/ATP-dependent DNA helicase PcrA
MLETAVSIDFNEVFSAELNRLNTSQQRAVETIEGPVLVIAGPGTGKTQIIAARIGYILSSEDTQARPQNIICLTYTDAGAIAMRKRLLKFIGPTAYRVDIFTFHAFCNEVIQRNLDYFGKRVLEPISELENITLLEELVNGLSTGHVLKRLKGDIYSDIDKINSLFKMMKEEDWSVEYVKTCCTAYLDDLPNREEYIYKRANAAKNISAGDLKKELIAREEEKMMKLIAAADLFPLYQERMLQMNRYDYSDMILWVINAFRQDENLLRSYQEKYLYFLVDEFQDTNGAQNELLNLLTGYWENPNIFTVGDDDQSIYEFQGARIKNIQDFLARYSKSVEKIVLTENYRSSQQILNAAQNVIENNRQRLIHSDVELSKDLVAAGYPVRFSAVEPIVYEYPNIAQEEAAIVTKILQLQYEQVPLHEIAVIYFRHSQSENLLRLMEKKNIPYQVRKKINVLNHPLIGSLITLLTYISKESQHSHSGEHYLFELMHLRFFGIDTHDIAAITAYAGSRRSNCSWREMLANEKLLNSLDLRNAASLISFEKNITAWISDTANLTLQMLFEKIMNESGLLQYILENDERIPLLQAVTTFFDFIKSECSRRPRIKIRELLGIIDQMNAHGIILPANQTSYKEDGVQFTTCHSAKGLEFNYVFLIGCTSDKWEGASGGNFSFSLPDTLTFTNDENRLESTRRLFYVAMTRAKEHLTISYATNTNDCKELEASQFIAESGVSVQPKLVDAEILNDLQIVSLQSSKPPKVELYDRDLINSMLSNFALSPSSLSCYLKCPVSFYFQNILRVPVAKNDSMAFGSAIHISLKRLFDKMRNNSNSFLPKEEFIKDFEIEMRRNKDAFTDKQFENRIELAQQVLPEYYDRYINLWNKVTVTEYMIRNVEVAGVPIKGMIDKIEFEGNDVNVVDYKTGSVQYGLKKLKPPVSLQSSSLKFNFNQHKNGNGNTSHLMEAVQVFTTDETDLYGGDYWRQIVFYKILLDNQKIKNWKMVSGEIDFIEKNEKTNQFLKAKIPVSRDETAFVTELIKSSYQKIMNHEFTEGCGKDECSWCSFVRKHIEENNVDR